MPRKRTELLDFLDYETYKILKELENGIRAYTALSKISALSRKVFDSRLKEIQRLGLIEAVLVYDPETGTDKKRYALTSVGREILELLDEINEVYKRKRLPEGEEFLKQLDKEE